MKKYANRFIATLLTFPLALSFSTEAFADGGTVVDPLYQYYTYETTTSSDLSTLTLYGNNLSNSNGTITTGNIPDYNNSIASLAPTVEKPLAAAKYATFEDADDAAEGIVRIDLDVRAQTKVAEAVDVVFVIDHSGGMNMLSAPDLSSNSKYSQYTCPCLNGDHYYRIPAKITYTPADGSSRKTEYFWYYTQITDSENMSWTNLQVKDGNTVVVAPNILVTKIKEKLIADFPAETGTISGTGSIVLNHIGSNVKTDTVHDLEMDYMKMLFHDCHYEYSGSEASPTVVYPMEGIYDDVNDVYDTHTEFTKITYNTTTQPDGLNYYSPNEEDMAETGCLDRITATNQAAYTYVKKLLENGTGSRVGAVLFSGKVNDDEVLPLGAYDVDDDKALLDSVFANTKGYDNTKYTNPLTKASAMFSATREDGRKRYVVFISDGAPDDRSSMTTALKTLQGKIDGLYTIGVFIGDSGNAYTGSAYSVLEGMAYPDAGYFSSCKTVNDIQNTIEGIYKDIEIEERKMVDIIGRSYDLYCSEDHPVTLIYYEGGEKKELVCKDHDYIRPDGAPLDPTNAMLSDMGLIYDSETEKFIWNVLAADENGMRLTFYEKYDSTTKNQDLLGNGEKTNEETTLTYTKDSGDGKVQTEESIPAPAVLKGSEILNVEAVLSSSGTSFTKGDNINYYITLTPDQNVENFYVSVPVPTGTVVLSIENGGVYDSAKGVITFTVDMTKNEPLTLSYKVSVATDEFPVISNTASFGLGVDTVINSSPNPLGDKEVLCETNTVYAEIVKNEDNTGSGGGDAGGSKKPRVSVTKESKVTLDEDGHYITYTVTAKNSGNGIARGVYIKDYIPEYTLFESVDGDGKHITDSTGEYVSLFLETLQPGEEKELIFTVMVDDCLPDGASVKNQALWTTTGTSNEPSNWDNDDLDNKTSVVSDFFGDDNISCEIIKVDSNDASTTLSGAKFELYSVADDGTEKFEGLYITGSTGKITVTGLADGEYYWKEIGAPAGYTLDSQRHEFEIENGKAAYFTIENERTLVPVDLNGDDHYAYIVGYPDGEVKPSNNITRAEVAMIFFRLLTDDVRDEYFSRVNSFPDSNEEDWFNTAVSTIANMGIISGYDDGTFKPDSSITRAEFAAIAARFDKGGNTTQAYFTDIIGHWAAEEISSAANNGWIAGYEDMSFRPNRYITRAEAMSLINRVLQRVPEYTSDLLDNMIKWPDNADTSMWYYIAVQEATNSHYYERKLNDYEAWTELRANRDWEAIGQGR